MWKIIPTEDRFWSKVTKTNECWLWDEGSRDKDGYGSFRKSKSPGQRRGPVVRAHRFSWELHNGPIPKGLWILHKCDNPPCVNPEHLYAGTRQDNANDIRDRKRHPKAQQTHCLRGHEFTKENTRISQNGTRHCKACNNLLRRVSKERSD